MAGTPPSSLHRRRVTEPLGVGVRAIDGLLTFGKGQRVGIFAGSGVGKSTLLGMIARNTAADVNVIALVGERGKEVRDFLERDLGPEGLRRSVVIVATCDQPALVRIKAAFVATRIAEYFRDQGLDVMLMMDSVTRFAMAQREVGPGDRRADHDARLHALGLRDCCPSCSSAPAPPSTARSPRSTPCWSTATT